MPTRFDTRPTPSRALIPWIQQIEPSSSVLQRALLLRPNLPMDYRAADKLHFDQAQFRARHTNRMTALDLADKALQEAVEKLEAVQGREAPTADVLAYCYALSEWAASRRKIYKFHEAAVAAAHAARIIEDAGDRSTRAYLYMLRLASRLAADICPLEHLYVNSRILLSEALRIAHVLADPELVGHILFDLATAALFGGQWSEVLENGGAALRHLAGDVAAGEIYRISTNFHNAMAAIGLRDPRLARQYLEVATELAEAEPWFQMRQRSMLGYIAALEGNEDGALEALRDAFQLGHDHEPSIAGTCCALDYAWCLYQLQRNHELAELKPITLAEAPGRSYERVAAFFDAALAGEPPVRVQKDYAAARSLTAPKSVPLFVEFPQQREAAA